MKNGGIGFVLVVLLLVGFGAVYAADIIVGGNSGWDQGFNYITWASSQTFRVGDTLVFNYGGNHKVDQVSEEGYKGCSSSNAIATHSGGTTSIPLATAGPMYFICPTAGHCDSGMKLQINVLATTPGAAPSPPSRSPPSPSPPSPSPPSQSPPSDLSPPSDVSPPSNVSPPPPTGSAAVTSMENSKAFMFAALFATLPFILI